MRKETLLYSIISLLLSLNLLAQNSRSDTIDVLHYSINLDFTAFGSRTIKGNCQITYAAKRNGIDKLNLDLLKLSVDSIVANGNKLTYTYNDTLIKISLPSTINNGDTDSVIVYYGGTPQKDPSWGGFYFDNNYAYNLGVGFDSKPHNLGRVWFPCFDNFAERSTYEFNIITSGGKKAHCSGALIKETIISGDTILRSWELEEEIPTYLAGIAISDYETVHQTYQGQLRDIPVELVARQPDTSDMKSSFLNLEEALHTYEECYGPYVWNKIGFSIVPFSSGAMEHATNIAYPSNAIDGRSTRETLMAHEFAHHWWGNLVTCETSEDMWINEGMASYSEHLFLEGAYGQKEYIDAVKANHKEILQFAHLRDGEYLAISGVGHDHTYSTHTYNKGASVAHNMRAYLGDSLFFVGLEAVLDSFQFNTLNAYQFRDHLTAITGVDMTSFFKDWVFTPGYSHFAIDSAIVTPNGSDYDVELHVQQKLKGASTFHNNTPLEVSFYDSAWNKEVMRIHVSGQTDDTTLTLAFNPSTILLNEANRLNQARTDDRLVVNSIGTHSLNSSLSKLKVNSISDSALLHIEHHWVAPDPIKNNPHNYRLSTTHYWSVEGLIPSTFNASLTIDYNNKTAGGYLDADLIASSGDSLILLYRRNAQDDWKEYSHYTKSSRFSFSTFGSMIIDSLVMGEYAFANGVKAVRLLENEGAEEREVLLVYPNPAEAFIWVEHKLQGGSFELQIYDVQGKEIDKKRLTSPMKLNTSNWKAGTYTLTISDGETAITKKVVIQ